MAKKAYIGVDNFTRRELPSGYTQVEYIESSGTQYIDTGVIGRSGLEISANVEFTEVGSDTQIFIGSMKASSNRIYPYSTTKYIGYGSYVKVSFTSAVNTQYDVYCKLYAGEQSLMINGETIYTGTNANTYNSEYSMYLFAGNKEGTADYKCKARIRGCKILESGTLVRDLVPCRRDSDREVGLYDMVHGTFYTNAGTGAFTCPLPLVELPQGYTQVAYIESSGTQYIDTGFTPNQDTRVVADFELTASDATAFPFCGRTAASKNAFGLYWYTSSKFYAIYGSAQHAFSITEGVARHSCDLNKNVATINGETYTFTQEIFTSTVTMAMFARNSGGTITKYPSIRMYSCRIYDNGTLIRDYVPCLNVNGAAGLYDTVNGVFYGNAGTGSFLVGSEVHNEVARKVSSIYLGIDNLARMVKKAYIGVGGIARPFFDITKLTYYGTIDPLSSERYYPGVITIGDYALIGGGRSSNEISSWDVDAYNKSLTKTTAKNLAYDKSHPPTARSSVHAFFGGAGGDHFSSTSEGSVDAYDASLTRFSPTSHRCTGPKAATQVNDYVLFGGGYDKGTYYDDVFVYNTSLTYTTTSLSLSRSDILGAYNKNYGLFIGGTWSNSWTTRVDAYDATLTRTTPFACDKDSSVSTTFFDYILIGAGWDETYIEIYDPSFTKTILTESTNDWSGVFSTATTLNDYALFLRGGGDVGTPFLEAYDKSFTKKFYIENPNGSEGGPFVTIGNYSLLTNGSEVHVYTIL